MGNSLDEAPAPVPNERRGMTDQERSDRARHAARVRWEKRATEKPEESTLTEAEIQRVEDIGAVGKVPTAVHRGELNIIGMSVPCYVLDNGVRVIGRTSATEVLTGIKGRGALEKYIAVRALV